MSANYKIIEVEKGTDEWQKWRHDGIGKTDAVEIMGLGFSFPGALLMMKKRETPPKIIPTQEQEEGVLLEPEARKSYKKRTGLSMPAICVQSTKHPWMKASLDGLSDDGGKILEISCGRTTYSKTSSAGKPPRYILPQLQHIMAVTGHKSIDFWCYRPTRKPLLKRINRDDDFIARLIAKENEFWKEVSKTAKLSEENSSTDDFMRPKVYVLELEGGYFYVGKCQNFPDRVERHIEGSGSLWTKLHRPIASVEFFWGDEEIEKSVTIYYMKIYGINRVRGWVFTKGGDYDEEQVKRLIKKASAPTPYDQLTPCTTLTPMKLPHSSEWDINSKNLDPGEITRDESLY